MDAQPFWKVEYLVLLRSLKAHAEALRKLAHSLESSDIDIPESLPSRIFGLARRFQRESQEFISENPRPETRARCENFERVAGDFLDWKHRFAGWYRSHFSVDMQQARDELAAKGLRDQELDSSLSDMSSMSQSVEKVTLITEKLRFLASHLDG